MSRGASTQTTKAKGKADRAFSLWIRRGGVCQRCGRHAHKRDPESGKQIRTDETVMLQCAHIASRRLLQGRWHELNALCLCAGCHNWMTDYPVWFGDWLLEAHTEHYKWAFQLQRDRARSPKQRTIPQPKGHAEFEAIAASYKQRLKDYLSHQPQPQGDPHAQPR